MGKRGRQQGKAPNSAFGSSQNNSTVTLREEKTGKKDPNSNRSKRNNNNNNKTVTLRLSDRLKIEHLEWLSSWAAVEAKIPSLASFYGQRLAAVRESLGVPRNPSLFQCDRCETVLKPEINCTVTRKKNKVKAQKLVSNDKPRKPAPNYLLYTCHFCSHRNFKRDNPNRVSEEVTSSKIETDNSLQPEANFNTTHETNLLSQLEIVTTKIESIQNSALVDSNSSMPMGAEEIIEDKDEVNSLNHESTLSPLPGMSIEETPNPKSNCPVTDGPATPAVGTGLTLLDGNKRKRKKSTAKKSVGHEIVQEGEKTSGNSSKRKRKSWTSLKQIAENMEQAKKNKTAYNSPVPFSL